MRDTEHAEPCRDTGAQELSIEVAIGAKLQVFWSTIPREPLPAALALAVAGLSLPHVLPLESLGTMEALIAGGLATMLFMPCLPAALLALYLLKTAAGVDLLDGPSFLHDLFFD